MKCITGITFHLLIARDCNECFLSFIKYLVEFLIAPSIGVLELIDYIPI